MQNIHIVFILYTLQPFFGPPTLINVTKGVPGISYRSLY